MLVKGAPALLSLVGLLYKGQRCRALLCSITFTWNDRVHYKGETVNNIPFTVYLQQYWCEASHPVNIYLSYELNKLLLLESRSADDNDKHLLWVFSWFFRDDSATTSKYRTYGDEYHEQWRMLTKLHCTFICISVDRLCITCTLRKLDKILPFSIPTGAEIIVCWYKLAHFPWPWELNQKEIPHRPHFPNDKSTGKRLLIIKYFVYDQTSLISHWYIHIPLLRHHNERVGVSNYQRLDCLLNRLFRHRFKKTSKLCATGLCEGNSPVTGEFSAEFTCDRWIPRTKGQWRGKCFHSMPSSWRQENRSRWFGFH